MSEKTGYTATTAMVRDFIQLFVNRRSYTLQVRNRAGQWSWMRAKDRDGKFLALSQETVRRHLEGSITLGLYSTNPETQRCKWLALDADYEGALSNLVELQYELRKEGTFAALERSRRGGHLWIFCETPLPAKECRLLVYNLADRLGLPVKGIGVKQGIEVFPRQDCVSADKFGNCIRAPFGVHRKSGERYWFFDAPYTLEAQFDYLLGLKKLSEPELCQLTAGMAMPERYESEVEVLPAEKYHSFSPKRRFSILEHVTPRRRAGRNYLAQCPSCAQAGKDRGRDNLAISIEEPRKYLCWAGCTKEMIRASLGVPPPSYARLK
jgi:hypothetical protein